jgi:predicted dehydrogenase
MSRPMKVAIIGAGDIFPAYAKGLAAFGNLELMAVADANPLAAQARAEAFGLAAQTVPQLLDGEAEIVVNLTPPAAHRSVGEAVLAAGKHLYTEKPLAASGFASATAINSRLPNAANPFA